MKPINVRKGLALLVSIFVIVAIMTPVLAGCGQEESRQGTELGRETLFQVSTRLCKQTFITANSSHINQTQCHLASIC